MIHFQFKTSSFSSRSSQLHRRGRASSSAPLAYDWLSPRPFRCPGLGLDLVLISVPEISAPIPSSLFLWKEVTAKVTASRRGRYPCLLVRFGRAGYQIGGCEWEGPSDGMRARVCVRRGRRLCARVWWILERKGAGQHLRMEVLLLLLRLVARTGREVAVSSLRDGLVLRTCFVGVWGGLLGVSPRLSLS